MGGSSSSYATAGIALRISGALKPHHHDQVEIPSVGPMNITEDEPMGTALHKTIPANFTV
jgi:hypothetical protein